jgi:hypothetical protein
MFSRRGMGATTRPKNLPVKRVLLAGKDRPAAAMYPASLPAWPMRTFTFTDK